MVSFIKRHAASAKSPCNSASPALAPSRSSSPPPLRLNHTAATSPSSVTKAPPTSCTSYISTQSHNNASDQSKRPSLVSRGSTSPVPINRTPVNGSSVSSTSGNEDRKNLSCRAFVGGTKSPSPPYSNSSAASSVSTLGPLPSSGALFNPKLRRKSAEAPRLPSALTRQYTNTGSEAEGSNCLLSPSNNCNDSYGLGSRYDEKQTKPDLYEGSFQRSARYEMPLNTIVNSDPETGIEAEVKVRIEPRTEFEPQREKDSLSRRAKTQLNNPRKSSLQDINSENSSKGSWAFDEPWPSFLPDDDLSTGIYRTFSESETSNFDYDTGNRRIPTSRYLRSSGYSSLAGNLADSTPAPVLDLNSTQNRVSDETIGEEYLTKSVLPPIKRKLFTPLKKSLKILTEGTTSSFSDRTTDKPNIKGSTNWANNELNSKQSDLSLSLASSSLSNKAAVKSLALQTSPLSVPLYPFPHDVGSELVPMLSYDFSKTYFSPAVSSKNSPTSSHNSSPNSSSLSLPRALKSSFKRTMDSLSKTTSSISPTSSYTALVSPKNSSVSLSLREKPASTPTSAGSFLSKWASPSSNATSTDNSFSKQSQLLPQSQLQPLLEANNQGDSSEYIPGLSFNAISSLNRSDSLTRLKQLRAGNNDTSLLKRQLTLSISNPPVVPEHSSPITPVSASLSGAPPIAPPSSMTYEEWRSLPFSQRRLIQSPTVSATNSPRVRSFSNGAGVGSGLSASSFGSFGGANNGDSNIDTADTDSFSPVRSRYGSLGYNTGGVSGGAEFSFEPAPRVVPLSTTLLNSASSSVISDSNSPLYSSTFAFSRDNSFINSPGQSSIGGNGASFVIGPGVPFSKRSRAATLSNPGSFSSHSPASNFLNKIYVDSKAANVTREDMPQVIGDYVVGKQIAHGGFSEIKEAITTGKNGEKIVRAVKIVKKSIFPTSSSSSISTSSSNSNSNNNSSMSLSNSTSKLRPRLNGTAGDPNTNYLERVQSEFIREVAIWKTLHHPNILNLIWLFENEEAIYCFADKISGGTLLDVIKHNPDGLKAEWVKNYSHQLACALRYLHEDMHIVHRDIKLENCLVEYAPNQKDSASDGKFPSSVFPTRVILCDFGMSEYFEYEDEGQRHSDTADISNSTETNTGDSHISLGTDSIRTSKSDVNLECSNLSLSPGYSSVNSSSTSLVSISGKSLHRRHIGPSDTSSKLSYQGPSLDISKRRSKGEETSPTKPTTPTLNQPQHHRSQSISLGQSNLKLSSSHQSPAYPKQLSRVNSIPNANVNIINSNVIEGGPCSDHGASSVSSVSQNGLAASTVQNCGSLPYAPPEIISNTQPLFEPSIDIWGFGVCVYTLACAELPFSHHFSPRLRMMILSGKWNQTKLGQKLNNEWVDFVKGCLTVDKAARSSISDVLNHKVFNGMKTV